MRLLPAVVVSLVLCVAAPMALPQEAAPSPESAAPVADVGREEASEPAALLEERELQARLSAILERAEKLRMQLRAAGGDEFRVLSRQLADLRLEYLGLIEELVDNLLRQEDESLDARALRKQIENELRLLPPRITSLLDDARKRIRKLQREREGAEDSELLGIEQTISRELEWGITLYRGLADTLDYMEALGMAAEKPRTDLIQDVTAAASRVAGRLVLEIEQLELLRARVAEQRDDAGLRARLAAREKRAATTSHALQVAIRLLQRLDQPATAYQKLLITTTGEVTADLFDLAVLGGLFDDAVDAGSDWIEQNGPNYAFRTLLFVFIVVFFRLLGRLVRKVVRRGLASDRVQASQLLRDMAASLMGNAVFLLGILFGLAQMGIELGPVLAGLGIVGFVVGFALQDVLGNFAAGVIILTIRPYDIGDMIEAAGVFGEVSHMSLVSTTILTIDNQTLTIPNGRIWGDVIKNFTHQKIRRVDMVFGVAYAEDIDHAERVLASILADHEKVLAEPAPLLKLHELSENSVDFIVRPWVDTPDYWDVYWDVTREVKKRFDEEGIRIPLPQREVRLLSPDDPSAEG